MLTVLLDTNVVLDTLSSRDGFRDASDKIFSLLAKEMLDGYVVASSITDIYYILRRHLSDKSCRDLLQELFSLVTVLPVFYDDCLAALNSPITDYEDALVEVCRQNANIDYIITRDQDFLKIDGTLSPTDFLKQHQL